MAPLDEATPLKLTASIPNRRSQSGRSRKSRYLDFRTRSESDMEELLKQTEVKWEWMYTRMVKCCLPDHYSGV